MKRRHLQSFEHAISQILTEIGEESAAYAVGKSSSLVRKWSDPDQRAAPSLFQAVELDLAYAKATGLGAPIFSVYRHFVSPALIETEDAHAPLQSSFIRLQALLGVAAILLLKAPAGDSPSRKNCPTCSEELRCVATHIVAAARRFEVAAEQANRTPSSQSALHG